jgi:hypothetical protein
MVSPKELDPFTIEVFFSKGWGSNPVLPQNVKNPFLFRFILATKIILMY